LENRRHLLALLTIITARKAVSNAELARSKASPRSNISPTPAPLRVASNNFADSANSPAEQALLNDLYSHFVSALPDELQDIAEQFLAGRSNTEIAASRGCAVRTV
jgi:DNA-binding NarL/FixJ family response regulator